MLVPERRSAIVRLVEQQGSVRVAELSALYGVTEETIRRDLEELEKSGYLRRTYGGAVTPRGTGYEIPFSKRKEKNPGLKKKIGLAAAKLIEAGDTVALDASTSVLEAAKYLMRLGPLTVLTNSLNVVMEFANSPDITVQCCGGTFRAPSLSFVGPLAERALRDYHVDKALISAKGLTLTEGLTDSNEFEVEIKKIMLRSARRRIVMIDSTKIGYVGFATVAGFDEIDYLVTDEEIDGKMVDELQNRGVQVIIAKE